jgi:hypothetical protein
MAQMVSRPKSCIYHIPSATPLKVSSHIKSAAQCIHLAYNAPANSAGEFINQQFQHVSLTICRLLPERSAALQLIQQPLTRAVIALSLSLSAHLFFCSPVSAQDPVRQNVLPEAPKKSGLNAETAALFPYRPSNAWQDQRFIFLFSPKPLENSTYDDFSGALKRKNYAGRIGKAVTVSDFSGRVHLELEMEDTREHVRARTVPNKESIKGLLLVEDLEKARQRWVGQTLWCRQMRLSTYDEQSDNLGSVAIKRYAPLKVVAINPGWDEEKPLRFVLQTSDGKQGFLDINLSGTNVPPEIRHLNRFDEAFLTEDPKLKYKWPARFWAAIENNRVLSGMTMEQVRLSWGEPDKTARTAAGEQWTFAAGVLTFRNGVLAGIQ